MPLQWSDYAYGTGVPELDAQHRQLFDRINRLLEATQAGRGSQEIESILAFLEDYTQRHFQCEERIMEQRRCSACKANKEAHRQFIQRFNQLKEKFQQEGVTSVFVIEVQELMVDWLSQHIIVLDRQLKETPPPSQKSGAS